MSKQIYHKYRLGYALYRRVPPNEVVYGERDGKVQYYKIDEEAEARVEGLLF